MEESGKKRVRSSAHSPKWTNEVEDLCEKLRINCVNLSEYHRKRYYHFKSYGKYFRLPLILLASINSTASVGLQPVLSQELISGMTCLIGMVMGIISAIELYMGIQTSMELELKQSKDFYSLAIDVYKTLSLQRVNRGEDGKDYLNKKYGTYVKLCEASQLLRRKLKVDLLTQIPRKFEDTTMVELNEEDADVEVFRKYQNTAGDDDSLGGSETSGETTPRVVTSENTTQTLGGEENGDVKEEDSSEVVGEANL